IYHAACYPQTSPLSLHDALPIWIVEVVAEYAEDIALAWDVKDFHVRVGVNSGQTAVGVVGAADQQKVALGDTTNVAARLQSIARSEEHTSELQSRGHLVCRLLLE